MPTVDVSSTDPRDAAPYVCAVLRAADGPNSQAVKRLGSQLQRVVGHAADAAPAAAQVQTATDNDAVVHAVRRVEMARRLVDTWQQFVDAAGL